MVGTLEIFRNSFITTGSIFIECSCGRLHIADDDYNQLEEDDKKSVEEFEKEHPERVIHYSCTSIEWFHFGNKQVVVGCPCKSDIKIHNLLMNNRFNIISFFKEVLKTEKKDVKMKEKLTEGL